METIDTFKLIRILMDGNGIEYLASRFVSFNLLQTISMCSLECIFIDTIRINVIGIFTQLVEVYVKMKIKNISRKLLRSIWQFDKIKDKDVLDLNIQ